MPSSAKVTVSAKMKSLTAASISSAGPATRMM
jgi:hypothetical protein